MHRDSTCKFGLVFVVNWFGPTQSHPYKLICGWSQTQADQSIHIYAHSNQPALDTAMTAIDPADQTMRVLGFGIDRFNDPSAGSPTETLLRLLLPLGGRV